MLNSDPTRRAAGPLLAHASPVPRREAIRRRLIVATMMLVVAVIAALAVSAVSQAVLSARSRDVRSADQAIQAVDRVSVAVRDAYAHQAHTIILKNRSHLGHYQSALDEARGAVDAARPLLSGDDATELASIAARLEELDKNFTESLLPNIEAGGTPLADAHDRALHLIENAQDSADKIAHHLEATAKGAETAAHVAERWTLAFQFAVLALALALSAGVALVVDRTISRPLLTLEAAAERLARGDLSARIIPARDDEIGSLARRLNEMAFELDARQRKLLESEKLAGIGRLAAGVAHEINNPLGVMLGYARLIEKRNDDAVRSDARAIVAEIGRCQAIVSGLLDLSRPQRLSIAGVDVAAVAREVAERVGSGGGGATIDVQTKGDVTAEVDEGKVRQILQNLVQNALDAAPAGRIGVDVDGGGAEELIVRVRDDGPGVAADIRAKLFEPFATTKGKGTGLGLAVSASLARAHRGALALVESSQGATIFELRLPRHHSAATAEEGPRTT